ncbi:MAG: hypothetical protein NTV01_09885 [Bacteroidia bacterium]|nr:hypothetical protein [Bacteroidia bacterium]
MPYRRLPTTDVARLKALHSCTRMAEISGLNQLAFPAEHIHTMRNIINKLEGAKHQQNQARRHQVAFNREYQPKLAKTRLYLSHFIQVLNFAIIREEVPESSRAFYGLEELGNRLPDLRSDTDILEWGKRVIEGENQRLKNGGIPIMTPNVARVKVWYDQFRDGYYNQLTSNKSTLRADQRMIEIRKEVDNLLAIVWDGIEKFYSANPEAERREQAEAYGIVYVFRKGEKETR